MTHQHPVPTQCPVCGARKIEAKTLTNSLVPNGVPEHDLRRYVCVEGHVFYVPAEAKAADASS